MREMGQRVVITGVGIVSPLGAGRELVWRRLTAGASGIRRLADEFVPDVPCKVAGVVPSPDEDAEGGYDPARIISPRELRKMDRFIQLAIGAADEALAQAGWRPESAQQQERTATIIGTALGGFPGLMDAAAMVAAQGVRRLSPFTIPATLGNMAAGQISIRHGLRGSLGAPVTACAAGLQAIGDAVRLVRTGEADVALAGGAEACIDRVSLGAFAAARALSTGFNDRPQCASRPFDRQRDGFVMGEGAAVLVVERLSHALARGVQPLAEVLGYGATADAHHVTAAPPDGEGGQRAMRLAVAQAELTPAEIGYISAHATSTPLGDASELAAITEVWGDDAGVPAISASKSAIGHLCGAAGAIAAAFTVLALRDASLPPTLNLEEPDEAAAGLDLIGPVARSCQVEHALVNSFGFGGVNASAVFGRWAG